MCLDGKWRSELLVLIVLVLLRAYASRGRASCTTFLASPTYRTHRRVAHATLGPNSVLDDRFRIRDRMDHAMLGANG